MKTANDLNNRARSLYGAVVMARLNCSATAPIVTMTPQEAVECLGKHWDGINAQDMVDVTEAVTVQEVCLENSKAAFMGNSSIPTPQQIRRNLYCVLGVGR